MATHSSILVWRILQTGEHSGLQSMVSQSDTTEQLSFHFREEKVPGKDAQPGLHSEPGVNSKWD